MLPKLSQIKGIHPGAILKREIKIRGLKHKDFAHVIHEYAQTMSAILHEKRSINPKLSIKLGMELGVDNDYFMLLQASYDVKKAQKIKSVQQETPQLKNIRKILFWDTDFNKIDWITNKKAVIKRVFERGNDKEINEIIRFYGQATIKQELAGIHNFFSPSFTHNVSKYIAE